LTAEFVPLLLYHAPDTSRCRKRARRALPLSRYTMPLDEDGQYARRPHHALIREPHVDDPVLLLVTNNQAVRAGMVYDLNRRFGADYQVIGLTSDEEALAPLQSARDRQSRVALIIVDEHLGGSGAIDFLVRAHALSPSARRVLLIDRGNWSSAHPVVNAMAFGQVDYHLYNPWRPVEWILYPAVSEFLAAWEQTQDPSSLAVRIVGEQWTAQSHQIRDMFSRVAVPYAFYAAASPEGRALLQEVDEDGTRLPVLVFYDGRLLVQPSSADVWQALGVATNPGSEACDVVVIGAGPAGLAAAVYAASEGLTTVVLERSVPGGQAGTSSLIRNYLGFQRGVSGEDLATRAVEQAWLFGTRFILSQTATALRVRDAEHVVETSDGSQIAARVVVIATGVAWRRLGIPTVENLVGSGVFYGAAGAEARAMQDQDVFIVGAGNSAGQTAMHMARYAASITMLVRGKTLRSSMSEYLVKEIEAARNIRVRFETEVVDAHGQGRLEGLTLRRRGSDATEHTTASALFLLIGAEPRTEWLHGALERDRYGFVLTGRDLHSRTSVPDGWPLQRSPLLLETSVPGVFAAGDVRSRSVKRVAAAVGEGSTAIRLVHEYLSGDF
jgi:thioredoxin reductase (NADPH)